MPFLWRLFVLQIITQALLSHPHFLMNSMPTTSLSILYGWFGILVIPTLLTTIYAFIIAFIVAPQVDINVICESIFGYLLYENGIFYRAIIPT